MPDLSSSPPKPEHAVRLSVASRLRALRQQHALTLDQLANASSVSKSMISKIERGEADPTTTVLAKLAQGLSLPLSALLADPSETVGAVHLKAHQQPIWVDPEQGFERRTLSPSCPAALIDFVRYTLPPASVAGPFVPHSVGVEETLYLSAGELLITLGTAHPERFLLQAGDSLFFRANRTHTLENTSLSEPCVWFLVIAGQSRPLS